MTKTAQKLKTQLAALPEKDREELAHFLWDTLDGEWGPDYSPEWLAELDRRSEEVRSGKDKGKTAEQVHAEVREMLCGLSTTNAVRKKNSKKLSATSRGRKRG